MTHQMNFTIHQWIENCNLSEKTLPQIIKQKNIFYKRWCYPEFSLFLSNMLAITVILHQIFNKRLYL